MKSKKILALAICLALSSSLSVFAEDAAIEGKAALEGTAVCQAPVVDAATAATQKPAEPAPEAGQLPPFEPAADISSFTAAKVVNGTTDEFSDSFVASEANQSSFMAVNGADVKLKNSAFDKTGDTTSEEGSNFYGQNAVILASDSTVDIDGCVIKSAAEGANAVFATGSKGHITVHDTNIRTTGNSSRGLDATYGGTVTANNINIGTTGAHCAALATDRGEGTINVSQSTLNTSGEGSPIIYSTGTISLSESKGTATGSEIAVVEGKNSIDLEYATLSGAGKRGVMIYQSMSGDAGQGLGRFSVKHSSLTTTSDGPMFYVTNTQARIYLEMTDMTFPGSTLIEVGAGQWGTVDANGGELTFQANQQALSGNIVADAISTVALELKNGSSWSGTMNGANTAKKADVSLDSSSSWNVTGTSYIDVLTDEDLTLANISDNGNTIYYNSAETANAWLGGKAYRLPNGGTLTPRA